MGYSPATKQVLINQLRTVFVARGYDGATLNNLASAANLSKASLYHHFPGGKPEMAAALVRDAIADLQRQAFRHLSTTRPPHKRIIALIDGFFDYTDGGQSDTAPPGKKPRNSSRPLPHSSTTGTQRWPRSSKKQARPTKKPNARRVTCWRPCTARC